MEHADIEPINNQVAFRFVEDNTGGRFNQQTGSGVIVVDRQDKQVEYARWGRVLAIGPTAQGDFEVGDIVLIENLRWTNKFMFDDRSYWLTTDSDILAVLPDGADAPAEIKNFLQEASA